MEGVKDYEFELINREARKAKARLDAATTPEEFKAAAKELQDVARHYVLLAEEAVAREEKEKGAP